MDLIAEFAGVLIGTGILTRLTNKFVFKKLSYKKTAFSSFLLISVFSIYGYGFIGVLTTVIWLIYDLMRIPEDKNQSKSKLSS